MSEMLKHFAIVVGILLVPLSKKSLLVSLSGAEIEWFISGLER